MGLLGFVRCIMSCAVEDARDSFQAQCTIVVHNKPMVDALKAGNYMAQQGYDTHASYFYDKANEERATIITAREKWLAAGGTVGWLPPGIMELPSTPFKPPKRS